MSSKRKATAAPGQAWKPARPSRWPASRLEGKVENRGLKNVGHQAKKKKHSRAK